MTPEYELPPHVDLALVPTLGEGPLLPDPSPRKHWPGMTGMMLNTVDDSRAEPASLKEYWFVSYLATGKGSYGNTVVDKHPAKWAYEVSTNPRLTDGPYVILAALRIDRETYDDQKDMW